MEENHEINESWHRIRGLECFTQEGSCQKKQNKLKVWSLVFEEQELQFLQEVVDPERIALVYSKSSSGCQIAP
jgi:hypothetical protein